MFRSKSLAVVAVLLSGILIMGCNDSNPSSSSSVSKDDLIGMWNVDKLVEGSAVTPFSEEDMLVKFTQSAMVFYVNLGDCFMEMSDEYLIENGTFSSGGESGSVSLSGNKLVIKGKEDGVNYEMHLTKYSGSAPTNICDDFGF